MRFWRWAIAAIVCVDIVVALLGWFGMGYAYEPSPSNVISRTRPSPDGASDETLRLGRHEFYKQTFGNEKFLTDVMGILNGPLRITNVAAAILALQGEGTTNLRVQVPEDVTIGGRTFHKGSYFDTGLDVPKGGLMPLGMAVVVSGWRVQVGITCAACHATVDPISKKVIEGAPNQDLNAGLLLALATNSTAYFMHTDVRPTADAKATEDLVDAVMIAWPPGNFDSLTDMKADPTQIPVSFTQGNYPYGWSGNFTAGPFHGLSSQNNNVHALNSDSMLLADSSQALFNLSKEEYLAAVLRNSAVERYRYDGRGSAAAFWERVKPKNGSPGFNYVVLPPTYPKGTLLSPDGTFTSSPGYKFWQQNNAMSAWQNTIVPPPVPMQADAVTKSLGRQVFERAGCPGCHSGRFLTNNRVVPNAEIAANPARAGALAKTENNFAGAVLYPFTAAVPIPAGTNAVAVSTAGLDPAQIDLGWAHHGSPGGYKVPSLIGLYWSAPYLHDGGVAVGRDVERELGLPGTTERHIAADPHNSLKALVDRDLRARVVEANRAAGLTRMNVEGVGHNYWVDRGAGFSSAEQEALLQYLLTYE